MDDNLEVNKNKSKSVRVDKVVSRDNKVGFEHILVLKSG